MQIHDVKRAAVFALGLFFAALPACAQPSGGVRQSGAVTPNDCAKWVANNVIADSGGTCGGGGGGSPGGSSGQVQYNNAGSFGGISGQTTNGTNTTFGDGTLQLTGGTSGTAILKAPATGGNTFTLPVSASDTIVVLAATQTMTNKTMSGASNTFSNIANASLTNSAITIGGQVTSLGGSTTNQGNGAKLQLSTGTTTTNDCVKFDANGNTVDNGSACGSGGSVSVTSASSNIVINPTPGTGTFTVGATYLVNAQTGTSYTIVSGDLGKLVTFSNAASVAVTLPQATGSFAAGASFDVQNLGVGVVTITPTTSTINGAATLTLAQNTGCTITSDGTNYQISACTAKTTGGTVTSITCNAGLSGGTFTTSGTCSLNLSSTNVWAAQQSNSITTLTNSTATFTPDGSNNNYKITLVHASCPCTLANPSATPVAGTSGIIQVIQSATGSDVISTWGSQYIYPGGTSTIAFSAGANAQDFLAYYVIDSTHILLTTGALNATH